MGTRYFSRVEAKDSRIKWEKADAATCDKLLAVIRNDVSGFARCTVFAPIFVPIGLLALFLFAAVRVTPPLVFSVSYVCGGVAFFLLLLVNRIRELPYLYPEKQRNIWIFRAKCADITAFSRARQYSSDGSFTESFDRFLQNHACFQKGGMHIAIPLPEGECGSDLVGKEYVFYKFNERRGNRWVAVPAVLID